MSELKHGLADSEVQRLAKFFTCGHCGEVLMMNVRTRVVCDNVLEDWCWDCKRGIQFPKPVYQLPSWWRFVVGIPVSAIFFALAIDSMLTWLASG